MTPARPPSHVTPPDWLGVIPDRILYRGQLLLDWLAERGWQPPTLEEVEAERARRRRYGQ